MRNTLRICFLFIATCITLLADAQLYSGTSTDKHHVYQVRLKINADSSVIFIYNTQANSSYAEYEGRIHRMNDTLFHISSVMTLGCFLSMRLAYEDTITHIVNDTIYLGLDADESKLILLQGVRSANGAVMNYAAESARQHRNIIALDSKFLNLRPGFSYYTILTSNRDKINGKPLSFRVGFNSNYSFKSGEPDELDIVIKGDKIWSVWKPLTQTGAFVLVKEKAGQ
jgi:hypothetical protein